MKNNAKCKPRNIKVFALNNGTKDGFNIYLDFSGQSEYLWTHRHNGLLYTLLENGIRLEELYRFRHREPNPYIGFCHKKKHRYQDPLYKMVAHLLRIIEEYLSQREAFFSA